MGRWADFSTLQQQLLEGKELICTMEAALQSSLEINLNEVSQKAGNWMYTWVGWDSVTVSPQSSRVPSSIINVGPCLCGVSLHVLLMSAWVSSRFSSFLTPPKNESEGRLTKISDCVCVCAVPCDGLVSHPECTPTSCFQHRL